MSIASTGGRLLAGATHLMADVRSTAKPLHPLGQIRRGRMIRYGAPEPVGVSWLDDPADDEALVRTSRAIGLPAPLPDFHGLALRLPGPTGHADLLFATTGWNRVARHLLIATSGVGPTLSTLLPYRTELGAVVLGARQVGTSYALYWAPVGGRWRDLGELRLEAADPDATVSFDPMINHPLGLQPYPWVRRLRERAYAAAREHRGA